MPSFYQDMLGTNSDEKHSNTIELRVLSAITCFTDGENETVLFFCDAILH
jgi:hypothetical protein